jgi:hypothetical protein
MKRMKESLVGNRLSSKSKDRDLPFSPSIKDSTFSFDQLNQSALSPAIIEQMVTTEV